MQKEGKRKRNQKGKKEEKRFFECKICGVVVTSIEELDLHYSLSHEEPGDSILDDPY